MPLVKLTADQIAVLNYMASLNLSKTEISETMKLTTKIDGRDVTFSATAQSAILMNPSGYGLSF